MVKKLYEWKLTSARRKTGWENDIEGDLGIMKINNWGKTHPRPS
jgi:hypothetical protein